MQWMKKNGINDADELYEKALDREWFWGTLAEEQLEWYEKWDKVLDGEAPNFQWFTNLLIINLKSKLFCNFFTTRRDKRI